MTKYLLVLVLFIFTTLFITTPIHAATFYVSTTGDDGNSGTSESQAWRTYTHAVKASSGVQPGDTIIVLPGTYTQPLEVTAADNSVQGLPGQPITIRAKNIVPFQIPQNDAQRQQLRQTVTFIDAPSRVGSGGTDNGPRQILVRDRNHIIIDGFWITMPDATKQPTDDYGFYGVGAFVQAFEKDVEDVTVQNLVISHKRRGASGHTIRVAGSNGRLSSQSDPRPDLTKNARHITIQNNTIYRSSPCLSAERCNENITFLGNVSNSVIQNNQIIDSENIGIDFIAREYVSPGPRYIVVQDNYIKDTHKPDNGSSNGLYTDGAPGPILFQRNRVISQYPINGVSLNAEPQAAQQLDTFANFIVRSNLFNVPFMAYNVGVNQADAANDSVDYSAFVHNVAINQTDVSQYQQASVLIDSASHVAIHNNIFFKTNPQSNPTIFNAREMGRNDQKSTWRIHSNLWAHAVGADLVRYQIYGQTYTGYQNYKSQSGFGLPSNFNPAPFATYTSDQFADYRLDPAVTGSPLTVTNGSGTNTTQVKLDNAQFFFDGYDIPGMTGDQILIGDQRVIVTQVNYEATDPNQRNTITIDRPISYTDLTSVTYYTQNRVPVVGLLPDEFFAPVGGAGNPTATPADPPSTAITVLDWIGSFLSQRLPLTSIRY